MRVHFWPIVLLFILGCGAERETVPAPVRQPSFPPLSYQLLSGALAVEEGSFRGRGKVIFTEAEAPGKAALTLEPGGWATLFLQTDGNLKGGVYVGCRRAPADDAVQVVVGHAGAVQNVSLDFAPLLGREELRVQWTSDAGTLTFSLNGRVRTYEVGQGAGERWGLEIDGARVRF